ncbi:hypothetical protein PORY_000149 [Pneumocystis oryctolagi]|uniref:Uncharacterized protein n=1 Tax=Pneumocystis oryctolagi TaxID=42067 RepID=A0ACB7CF04_9ASCO|nr:hypothetical protein PORY_000149 [Pneumocystis oryctolagi]
MSTQTLRRAINTPEFAYFHVEWCILQHKALDALAWQQRITQALDKVLGIVGAAIPTEILHITPENHAYIRVPAKDGPRFWAALTATTGTEKPISEAHVSSDSKTGLRVLGFSNYLMGLLHRSRDFEQSFEEIRKH